MKLASIQVISEIRPIDGADRIEAATVLGYQTVIKKGEFSPGDLCVWHEPDTVVAEKPDMSRIITAFSWPNISSMVRVISSRRSGYSMISASRRSRFSRELRRETGS